MEFRKIVTITLYVRQLKRHRCIEQSFGLCGRWTGWDDLGGWHWNMYNIIYETNRQSRFDAWHRMLRAGALGWPRGMVREGRWEGASEWGTRVYPLITCSSHSPAIITKSLTFSSFSFSFPLSSHSHWVFPLNWQLQCIHVFWLSSKLLLSAQ